MLYLTYLNTFIAITPNTSDVTLSKKRIVTHIYGQFPKSRIAIIQRTSLLYDIYYFQNILHTLLTTWIRMHNISLLGVACYTHFLPFVAYVTIFVAPVMPCLLCLTCFREYFITVFCFEHVRQSTRILFCILFGTHALDCIFADDICVVTYVTEFCGHFV